MRLNDRQTAILKRLVRSDDGIECVSPDVARQLERKGLVRVLGDWHRMEWNRVVAPLSRVELTDAGKATTRELGIVKVTREV